MTVQAAELVGNWVTEGTQSGWSAPASGGWRGNLVLRANGTSRMNFTDGNVARARNGNWSLNGARFSLIDTEGTRWSAQVTSATALGGDYDSGPPGAAGGNWSARKV